MEQIAARSVELGIHDDGLDALMDLSAAAYTIPMRFSDLLAADNFNFGHDMGGIKRHLNRTTGEVENFFLPRFAKPQPEAEPVTT